MNYKLIKGQTHKKKMYWKIFVMKKALKSIISAATDGA